MEGWNIIRWYKTENKIFEKISRIYDRSGISNPRESLLKELWLRKGDLRKIIDSSLIF